MNHKAYFCLLGLICTVPISFAGYTFDITPLGTSNIEVSNNQSGTVKFNFLLTSKLNGNLYLNSITPTSNVPSLTYDESASTCQFLNTGARIAIPPYGTCKIVYEAPIPHISGDNQQTYNLHVYVMGGYGYPDTSPTINLTVYPSGYFGHIEFLDSHGNALNTLNLSENSTGSISVYNAGSSTISEFTTSIPSVLTSNGFSTNCSNSLPGNSSCTINYNLTGLTENIANAEIVANGKNADNSPQSLTINADTSGHLVFLQGGETLHSLNLTPSENDSLIIKNTGGSNITNFAVSISPSLINNGFTTTCPTSPATFTEGQICSIRYDIPATPTAVADAQITAQGEGSDNSPQTLTVNISAAGHFSFKHNGITLDENTLALNLEPAAEGTISIANTGGSNISNFVLHIPTSLEPYILVNSCDDLSTLPTSSGSCTLTYNFTGLTANIDNAQIVANGKNADNSPQSLSVNADTSGHLVFTQDDATINNLELAPSETHTIVLRNTGGSNITNFTVSIPTSLINNGFTTTCPTSSATFTEGQSCSIRYDIPATPTAVEDAQITAQGEGSDNSPQTLTVNISTAGHLVFLENGDTLHTLNLAPSENHSLIIENTGGSNITNFTVSIPTSLINNGFTTTCPTSPATFTKGQSCSIRYAIPATPTAVEDAHITAQGEVVDNSPQTLTVNISTAGHLIFKHNGRLLDEGDPSLNLGPSNEGTLTVSNSGGSSITDFALNIPSALESLITTNSCREITTLNAASSCELTYQVPTDPTDIKGTYSFTTAGTHADNTPSLTVNVDNVIPAMIEQISSGKNSNQIKYILEDITPGIDPSDTIVHTTDYNSFGSAVIYLNLVSGHYYKITLLDSFHNGWDGSSINIIDSSKSYTHGSLTLESGGSKVCEFNTLDDSFTCEQ